MSIAIFEETETVSGNVFEAASAVFGVPLTESQQRILGAFYGFVQANGYQPNYNEVARSLGMTRQAIDQTMPNLFGKGYVRPTYHPSGRMVSRCLVFLKKPDGSDFAGFRLMPGSETAGDVSSQKFVKSAERHRRRYMEIVGAIVEHVEKFGIQPSYAEISERCGGEFEPAEISSRLRKHPQADRGSVGDRSNKLFVNPDGTVFRGFEVL